MTQIERFDAVASDPRWMPFWGWHDDHRANDRTPQYLPALQQVRAETAELLEVLAANGRGDRALQLGLGATAAPHAALQTLFEHVVTIDEKRCFVNTFEFHGLNTHLASATQIAAQHAPYDFLMIDAGHTYSDVDQDYVNYSPLVRAGGLIAFHDACRRPGYVDEVQVWRYLECLPEAKIIGTEVGIAWIRK